MKHNHWFSLIYRSGCAPCKLRQLTYGYRFEPVARNEAIRRIHNDPRFTAYEKLWILSRAKTNGDRL